MADENGKAERPGGFLGWVANKAYTPFMILFAFTLSFILAESMGPLGAVLGLGLGAAIGWAGARWFVPRYKDR